MISTIFDILNSLPIPIMVLRDRNLVLWNKAMQDFTGVEKKEISDYHSPFYSEKHILLLDLLNGQSECNDYSILKKEKDYLYAEMFLTKLKKYIKIFAYSIKIDGLKYDVEIVIDVTDIISLNERLDLLNYIIDNIPLSILITDIKGNIQYVNDTCLTIMGYNREEIIGQNPRIFSSGIVSPNVYKTLWDTILSGNIWSGVLHNKTKSGLIIIEKVTIYPIKNNNFIAIKENINEISNITNKLNYSLTHDGLTGFYNRNELEKVVKNIMDDENINSYILIIDIDNFKLLNEIDGYSYGDKVLQEFSKFLKMYFGMNNFFARLGSDEFAIILYEIFYDNLNYILKKFHEEVKNRVFIIDNKEQFITVCSGIAKIDKRDINPILSADLCCISSKDNGPGNFTIFESSYKISNIDINLIFKIKKSLIDANFILFIQPIKNIKDDKLNKNYYEVLVRLIDKESNALLYPKDFFHIVEKFMLSYELDIMIMEHLFKLIHEHKFLNIKFTINLSSQTMSDKRIISYVNMLLKKYNINPHNIGFEMTETTAFRNEQNAREFIKQMREIGCIILLDDFGSGMSTFSRIIDFDIDVVKIDGRFIKDIEDDIKYNIVKSIVDVCKKINIPTVAEFVSSESIFNCVKELEIDYAQGYYTGIPVPICNLICPFNSDTCLFNPLHCDILKTHNLCPIDDGIFNIKEVN